MKMKCLLCDSENVVIKETHAKEDLAILWRGIYPAIDNELKLDSVHVYQCKNCGLSFFDSILAGGNEFYSELGKSDWYYLHPGKTEYDYVQKYIKKGDKILDIGAGRGVLFTKIREEVVYTGLELSSKAVELAKESNINVRQEDLVKHAQDHPSYYDIVCLFQVLEHLTELDKFLKSVQLTLKDDGLFVIAVPDNDGFISHLPNYTFNLPPHHTLLWTEGSLRYLAKKYNFEVVQVEREALQDIHRDNAYFSYVSFLLRRILFLPDLLIDDLKNQEKFGKKVYSVLRNRWFNKFVMPVVKKRQKYGQSIIVTLKKNKLQ